MAETDRDQKTEEPTEKRLNDAVDRGQFARSQELAVLFSLAAVLCAFGFTAPTASRELLDYAARMFTRIATTRIDEASALTELAAVLTTLASVLGPLLVAVVIAALLACGVQSGFRLTPKAVAFKPENLNPVAGFQRHFSKSVFIRSGIDVLKLVGIGLVLWFGARGLVNDPLFSSPVEVLYLGQFLHQATALFLMRLLLALGVVAAVSYGYERFKNQRELMMTREEIKEERKNAEGNMLAKAAMRRMARRLMQKQMLSAVQTADVVVTNPTHFAVALKYERGRDQAPVVLAKGENRFAQRIKAIAAEHGVPMVENKPVARLLFALGRVGETIPAELYEAVAGILAVVYRTHRYYFHRLPARRLEVGAA